MKLIDADALIEIFDKSKYGGWGIDEYQSGYNDGLLHAEVVADNQPTVDTVPIIRCRDCKYKNEYGQCTYYINFHHWTADMDYCSDAERRDKRNG